MKRLIFLWCASVSFLLQSQTNSDLEDIKFILNQQQLAWNKGDINAFMEGYWDNDSLVFVGSNGPTYGYQNTLLNYKKGYPDREAMGELTFTFHHFKQWDSNTIQVIGEFLLKRKEDAPTGYFTLLFRRFSEGWKIVSDHSSSGQ